MHCRGNGVAFLLKLVLRKADIGRLKSAPPSKKKCMRGRGGGGMSKKTEERSAMKRRGGDLTVGTYTFS